jgi:hypothetical protein
MVLRAHRQQAVEGMAVEPVVDLLVGVAAGAVGAAAASLPVLVLAHWQHAV